jgi:hypothetical protein
VGWLRRAEEKPQRVEWIGNNTKQNGLSTEPAKQQQTMALASEPSEPATTPVTAV